MVQFKTWFDGKAKNISFVVTERCQLACKYCYEVRKDYSSDMDYSTAKKAIDIILQTPWICNTPAVIWEFIGGEPLLMIDLISMIADYIVCETKKLNHIWKEHYMFSIATNGLLYMDKRVQDFISKHQGHVSISISIDGTKERHDSQRVYINGKGSFDDVLPNVKQWVKDFSYTSVKSTISHNDMPFIRDSVLFLFSLGVNNVHMNPVYEDVWTKQDAEMYEEQLYLLADEILDRKLYLHHSCSLFDETIGSPLTASDNNNWCGCGEMIAINYTGHFFPCIRFADFSLSNHPARVIGDINNGFIKDLMRPFQMLSRSLISEGKCMTCTVSSGCGWCQGLNYDLSEYGTIYNRCTNICELHKSRVRANNYYWASLREREKKWKQEW